MNQKLESKATIRMFETILKIVSIGLQIATIYLLYEIKNQNKKEPDNIENSENYESENENVQKNPENYEQNELTLENLLINNPKKFGIVKPFRNDIEETSDVESEIDGGRTIMQTLNPMARLLRRLESQRNSPDELQYHPEPQPSLEDLSDEDW